ncbi:small proline-rich protein 4 [Panthera onca]|uniref:Small proline rich protein 4 n=3 Tax=Pantherinae TaxID=338153 RepID=A0A8C8XVZ7_PANLE|nr:small proline-rich protein 4 [Panthera tigris]XP_042808125.1 small proline-rich protein 4 [Panthera leo]XP_049471774.1 small proline-rich protein 4 [Panthera uncia]XP_060481905.1 small proline-rich protein 4 [Panthera onca]
MSSWQQQTIQHLPQKAQQQVKQPCQPPSVRCQEMCAPQIKDPCAPQPKKQYPPKGTAMPTQPPSAPRPNKPQE